MTIRDTLQRFAAQILSLCECTSEGSSKIDSLLKCDSVDDMSACIVNKYQRQKFAKENLPYVQPQEHTSDSSDTFQYVPGIKVLQNMLLSDIFRDSSLFDRRTADLVKEGSQFTRFLMLYSYELEIANPLGSKRGFNKLFVVYFSVVNIHARYRSQLSSIHVAIIAKYTAVQKHGSPAVMEPVLKDINLLSGVGFTVNHCSTHVKVTAVLLAFCGDNLSMNKLGGFSCNFSKGRPCRFCVRASEDLESSLCEIDTEVWTENVHRHHLHNVLEGGSQQSRIYGVKATSPLLDITYFDVSLQLPSDLMHDLIEGVVPHVLQQVLNGLITHSVLTYSDLDRVAAFNYGFHDRKNKPEPLARAFVQGHASCKGTASQMGRLFYLFSIIFGDILPKDNQDWEIYLKLRDVVGLGFADELPRDHIAYLQDSITFFLTAFTERYPAKMIPKLLFFPLPDNDQ
ncbi:uncharacterized protein LOC135377593 [Ornithodoros turicata]|uniref:uncharacterized protein LOC135377593 n=1 Tax=Ornithodoros turicata TaxID=34597 RepID=UPI00313A2F25